MIASEPVGSSLVLLQAGFQGGHGTLVTGRLESRMGEEWVLDTWGVGLRKISRAFARENQLDDDSGVLCRRAAGVPRGGGRPGARRHHHEDKREPCGLP